MPRPANPSVRTGWALPSFVLSGVPPMARQNYARELTAALFFPFALTAFEGSIISVLVKIAFEGSVERDVLNRAVSLLAVIPALANISSFVWVRLSHGKDKVRFLRRLQLGVAGVVFLMGLAPRNGTGLWLLVAGVLVARGCWAGIATIRSTIWHANYPAGARARITGRFAAVQVTLIALLGGALGNAMDADERAFRVMFPLGAAVALIGWWIWGGIRVRGHARLLFDEVNGNEREMPSFNPAAMVRVLAADRRYAVFMGLQFLLGIGNITSMAVLALILRERFETDYSWSIRVATSIPMLMMPLAIPFWAKLLDRTHIVHFRAIHSWLFVAALACLASAAYTGVFWIMIPFAVLKGVAFGGGVLGWTLGHLDFAPPGKASNYMGVHVTLTGVRGIIAWLAGESLYDATFDPARPGTAAVVPLCCLVLTILGAVGFVLMSRWYRRGTPVGRPEGGTEASPPARVTD